MIRRVIYLPVLTAEAFDRLRLLQDGVEAKEIIGITNFMQSIHGSHTKYSRDMI